MNSFKIRTISRNFLARIIQYFRNARLRFYGADIHKTVVIERNVSVDRWNPYGVHVGKYTHLTAGVEILAHKTIVVDNKNHTDGIKQDTFIGMNCIIGRGAIIMAGINIGDEVLIGAGSIVTKNIPSRCIAVGNPARIIKENIVMEKIIF